MIEVRWHGRGGQGAWTASNLLAMAVSYEGKYVQSFPAFGPERSGAPVLAFTRISDEPIDLHSMVYEPDIVVVLDYTLLGSRAIVEGLKKNGYIIINYSGDLEKIYDIIEQCKSLDNIKELIASLNVEANLSQSLSSGVFCLEDTIISLNVRISLICMSA